MKTIWIIGPLVAVGLIGCAEMLKNNAIEKLKADCAGRGLQFVQTEATAREYVLVSKAEVSGECVGPGDPRYMAMK